MAWVAVPADAAALPHALVRRPCSARLPARADLHPRSRRQRQRQHQLAEPRARCRSSRRGRQAGAGAVVRRHLRPQGEAARPVAAPAGPGGARSAGLVIALVVGQARPRHRARADRDRARHALGGRRAGPAVRRLDRSGRRGRDVLRQRRAGPAGRGSRPSSTRSPTTTAAAGRRPTAFYALSTGGWWGSGIGASQQKWGNLPEAHTDFIFAVIGEELGLVGTLLVLALFLTLAYAGIRIATRTTDPFVRYMAAGIIVWLIGADADQHRHGARTAAGHRASRCRWSRTAAPRCCRRWWRSACCCRFARAEPGAQAALRRQAAAVRAAAVAHASPREHAGALKAVPSVVLAGGGTRRPHLTAARHRRRAAAARSDRRDHLPRHRARARDPRRPGGRLPARADPAGAAAAPAQRRPARRAGPAAGRRRCGPRGARPGDGPTSWSASAATSRCRPTSPPGGAKMPIVVHEGNALPGIANKLGARYHPARRDVLPRHRSAARRVRRPADPAR